MHTEPKTHYGEGLLKGIVKRWNRSIGYGFIKPEGGGEAILVHHKDLKGAHEMEEGQKVEFEVDRKSPRPKAIGVKVIG